MKSSSIRKKTLALLLMLCMALFALPAFAQEFTVTKTVEFAQELPGTNDELFSAYLEQELYAPIYGDISLFGTSAGNALSAQHKLMYDALKARIEKVANGTSTSTVFTIDPSTIAGLQYTFTAAELGVSDIVVGGSISSAAADTAVNKFFGADDELFNALLHDCPLELYWFDKSVDNAMNVQASFSSDGETLTVSSLTVTMQVAKSYQNGSSTKVKAANISAVISAAQAIVDKHASKSDTEKLEAYRDEICTLASYNEEAADNASTPYGDPWQMIYVFDGDKSTEVVCEGYSKAFQYLCDLSSFDNAECYTVSGMMGSEPHMWNIVKLDGVSYLVDVTNSDTGTAGANGGLFLNNTPAEGSVETGYTFVVSGQDGYSQGIHYAYDQDTISFWGEDVLTLGGVAEHVCDFSGKTSCSPYYDGDPDTQHILVTQCTSCDKTQTSIENHYLSSEATCKSPAFCEPCGIWFGDYDDSNHENDKFYYKSIGNQYHQKYHDCCDQPVDGSKESHTETTPATCQNPAYCAVCDSSYGSKAPNTHALSTYKYVVNSSDPEKHDKIHECCGKVAETVTHNYSEATCLAPATCADCGHTTGDKGEHNMDASGKCTLCGTEAAAKFSDDAYHTVTYYADYIDLQNAIIHDHAAGTIMLLKDQTETNSPGPLNLISGNNTTLNLNGKTLAYGLVIDNNTNVFIEDSSTSGKGTIANYSGVAIEIFGGTIKIADTADCFGASAGREAWNIKNSTSAPLTGSVTLPAGAVLVSGEKVIDSIPVNDFATCHKHSFNETTWDHDGANHWHACSGCDAKKDETSHIFDADGQCTVCKATAVAIITIGEETIYLYSFETINDVLEGQIAEVKLFADYSGENGITASLNIKLGADVTLDTNGNSFENGIIVWGESTLTVKNGASTKGAHTIEIEAGSELIIDASAAKDNISVISNSDDAILKVDTDILLPEGYALVRDGKVVTELAYRDAGVLHQHSFDETSWTPGETTHWHACSGCDAKKDETSHIFDADGQCTVCKATAVAIITIGEETINLYSFETINAVLKGQTAEVKLFADYSDENGITGALNIAEGANVTLDMNGNSFDRGIIISANSALTVKNTASTKGTFDNNSLNVKAGSKLIIDASAAEEGMIVMCSGTAAVKVGKEIILPEGYVLRYDSKVVTELASNKWGYLHQHSWETGWTADETTHWHACSGCDAKKDETTHTGGTATCMTLAECSVCGEAYGSVIADAHSYTYTVSGGTIIETCANGCTHRIEATIQPPANLAYDGAAKNATIEDKFSGRLDLTITYNSTPVAPGKYTASIKVGDKTASIEFEIAAAALNAEVTLSPETVIYNGSEQKPTVVVNGLTEGTDYTVTFPADMTNAGEKTITVTGMGNYSGIATKTFTIEKASLTAADFTFTAPANLTYDGKAKTASVTTVKTDAAVTVKYSADPVNVGDYTVSIDVAESANYKAASLSDAAWTFSIAPKTVTTPTFFGLEALYLHTGSAIEPAFTLKDGETEIPAGEYTVAYSNNVNIGTATVTVSDVAGGNYTVSGTATFAIATHEHVWSYTASGNVITATCSGDLGSCPNKTVTLTVTAASAVYDGSAKTASVTVDPAGAIATPAITYSTADGSAPVNAGTYDASITLGDAAAKTSLTIEKANLTADDFIFTAPANLVYDGSTKMVKIMCTKTDCVITVKYSADPVNVGTYTVSIDVAQSKNYNNTSLSSNNWTFAITPASIASATVTAAEQVYTGEEIKPTVTVTLGGKTLLEGTDFTAAYSDNTAVGTAKITVNGMGNYEGAANGTFEIKASASDLTASTDKTAYTYGDKITVTAKAAVAQQKRSLFALRAAAPTMGLYYGETKIAEAEVINGEATIVYDTADRAFAAADNVTLTVRFSGDANMAESEATVSFSMSKKTVPASLEGSASKVYDGTADLTAASGLSFTVSGILTGDTVAVSASSFAFDNANVGANKAVTASGLTLDETSAKYYELGATEATANVGTITPASIADATVTADNEVYTGNELKPAVTVTLGGKTLTEGTDFTVAYSDNVNVGTAKITVTGMGNYEGTANGTFEIGKARPVTEAPAGLTAVYGDLLSSVNLPDHDLGTWNWVNPDVAVGNAGVQTHEVIFVPFDAEQYISVTLDAKVTVTKADMTFGDSFKVLLGTAENTAFTYGDTVTVTARPDVKRSPIVMSLRSFVAPKANQMALFCGDQQISEAVDPDSDGVYTMTYDTTDKTLAAGSSTITAKYVGTENLNDFSASAAITIAKRELTITSVKANNRIHKAGNTKVTVTGAEFDDKLSGDDVNIATVKGDVGSDAIGIYTTVTLPELALTGSDASFYTLKPASSAATNVEIVAVPQDLPVEPELDSFDDTDISDELKDAGFDTTDDVTDALKSELDDQVAKAEAANPTTTPGAQPKEIVGTETFNIGIVYNEDGEKIEGDPEHFPQSGLTVLLPIPEGTSPDTHEYYGSFMTGSTNGDQIAGSVIPLTVEVVAGGNGEQMLRVEIPAMGQVMIGWVAKPVNLPETGDASNILLWLAMLAISCPAMLLTTKKMKRSVR